LTANNKLGGSQVVSYPPASHKCSDTTALISKSCGLDALPIITVTFNYRVNIFGFGDGSEKNLALKDQRLAIEWVVKHIGGFGGDKVSLTQLEISVSHVPQDNITLAGESAGAIYTQAHLCTGAPVRRGILQSGSLFLSPPLPYARGDTLLEALSKKLEENHHSSLREAPVPAVLQVLKDQKVNTLWIQEERDLVGWQDRMNDVEELLIGDVEYESVIWRNGLENVDAAEISAAFDTDTGYGSTLRHLYGISPNRPDSSRIGALDFINDVRFALPSDEISHCRRAAGKKTYQYVFDQPNPWNKSSRAHHCVDMLFLFPATDCPYFDPSGDNVKHKMLECWSRFITGKAPWNSESRYAFGPWGRCEEISDEEFAARRRVKHFEILKQMDPSNLVAIFGKLAAGRISLVN
jgi:carboxylesterase type B